MLQHSKLLITKIFQEKIFGSVWQKIFETKNELRWWRRWFVMCRRRVFSVTGIINKDILTVVASVMCWHQIWELFTLMNPSIMVMVSLNNINHNIQDSYWSLLQLCVSNTSQKSWHLSASINTRIISLLRENWAVLTSRKGCQWKIDQLLICQWTQNYFSLLTVNKLYWSFLKTDLVFPEKDEGEQT